MPATVRLRAVTQQSARLGAEASARVYCADSKRPIGVVSEVHAWPEAHLHVATGRLAEVVRRVPASAVAVIDRQGIRLTLTRSMFLELPISLSDFEVGTNVFESMHRIEPIHNLGAWSVEVVVADGMVTVTGNMRTEVLRRRALAAARRAEGVVTLDDRVVADDRLVIDVARSFLNYLELQPSRVRVEASFGRVVLRGVLPCEELVRLAVGLAERVSGVVSVESRIVIAGPENAVAFDAATGARSDGRRRPEATADRLDEALQATFPASDPLPWPGSIGGPDREESR